MLHILHFNFVNSFKHFVKINTKMRLKFMSGHRQNAKWNAIYVDCLFAL